MTRKISGAVGIQTRRKLEGLAAARFSGGIGKATIFIVLLGLDHPDHANTMADGQEKTCSVYVEEDLVERITSFQVTRGIAKRTDATKLLIEIGLSVVEANGGRTTT